MKGAAINAVVVAIPARNEESLLGECLRSVGVAADALRPAHPGVRVEVVVTLDCCTDFFAEIAAAYPVTAVPSAGGCVGSARDTSIRAGVALVCAGGGTQERTWIACTDADTSVRALAPRPARLADRGTDLVVGTVEPACAADPLLLRRWRERHRLVEGHPHVHGANLAMRATTWRTLGGFKDHAVHEDVRLVERARVAGVAVSASDRTRVHTSARQSSRVDDGFAAYLAAVTQAG